MRPSRRSVLVGEVYLDGPVGKVEDKGWITADLRWGITDSYMKPPNFAQRRADRDFKPSLHNPRDG